MNPYHSGLIFWRSFQSILKFHLFLAVLVFIAARSSSLLAGSRGYSLVVVNGLLIEWLLLLRMHGLQYCGTWAYLLHRMWDLPKSGIESVSPALADGFFTAELAGKPL